MSVKPLAQFIRRSQVPQPGIERSVGFCQSPRPQPVHQHARAIVRQRLGVNPFESNRHARCILTLLELQCRYRFARTPGKMPRPKRAPFALLSAIILIVIMVFVAFDSSPRKSDAELGL